jgi:apolipoprotein N-acyltransferase
MTWPNFRIKIGVAILSGLMLTVSFPPGKLDWVAWIALVPLLWSLKNEVPSRAFVLGFIAGVAHYLTLIYWIVVVLEHYGGLPFAVSLFVLILFCLYLALFPALFSYLIRRINGPCFPVFTVAGIWVGIEYLRAKLLSGFPWSLLGYSQYKHVDLIQIADLVGVYGISFLILVSNALIYVLLFDCSSIKKVFFMRDIPVIVVTVFFVLAYGHHQLSKTETKGSTPLKVAIIQGNIDQSMKWNPAYQIKTINIYERLTRTTRPFKPNLVVWPETALPFFFQDHRVLSPRVAEITMSLETDLIFGSPAYKKEKGDVRYYNRAYSLTSDGRVSGFYDKVHLVPFGEYVPLKRFLPFVHRLVPAAGDMASGKKIAPLKLPGMSAGILICFEAIFPELSRKQTKNGAEILVNLTNDAWFGMTSAPHQHLSMAIFRSVENKRPMIRAANTGVSAFIGPRGEIISMGEQFREEVLMVELKRPDSSLTFYTSYGDLFILALVLMVIINVIIIKRVNSKQ